MWNQPFTKAMNKGLKNGIGSFLMVLFFMPAGHALMVLIGLLEWNKFYGAGALGFSGLALLYYGIRKNGHAVIATISGFIAGVLMWTGWVEFSFVWIAEKLAIPHLSEDGKVVTKAEYLVMMSSFGLLASLFIGMTLRSSKCVFFIWIQKLTGLKQEFHVPATGKRLLAVITFTETIMLLWFFYLVLLMVYDSSIAGDQHPATWIVAFGSLAWALWLINRLIRIQQFDYAVRYAIPTVIIFWNFVEILGRWNLFKEIWVHPVEHWIENTVIGLLLIAFVVISIRDSRKVVRITPGT